MKHNKIKSMTTGAMIAAIFGVLFFLDLYFGNLFGYYLYFILASLMIYYIYHYSMMEGIILGIVIFFITLFTGSPVSLFYAVTSVIAGLAVGYAHKRGVKDLTIISIGVGISIINNILSYTVLSKLLDMDLIDELTEAYEFASQYFTLSSTLQQFLELWPLAILIFGLVEGYCMLMCSMLILPRLKMKFSYHINYLEMVLPRWILLATAALIGICMVYPNSYINCIKIIFEFFVLIQGFSLAAYVFVVNRNVILYFLTFILLIGAIVIWPIRYSYFIMGVVDILFGLKKKLMYNVRSN